jgi:3-hydroxyacyl-[acyl-carrier-protein] dehydratase
MWIDRIVELVERQRLVAIKHVSLAEEHLHDHFAESTDPAGRVLRPATPIMPASLIIEGMAQAGGILVGHAEGFREKVILAKVTRAELSREATPGCTLRYTAEIRSFGDAGAGVSGRVELAEPDRHGGFAPIGSVELIFSHLDRNLAGVPYPDHNFVFGEGFKTLLRNSGIAVD